MVMSVLRKLFGSKQEERPAAAPGSVPPEPAKEPQVRRPEAPGAGVDVTAFVEYVVKSLVDAPEAVEVKTIEGDRQTTLQVSCQKRDVGKVIGKSGKTIAAIRTLSIGAAARMGKKVNVEILD